MRILIVDDLEEYRRQFETELKSEYQVITAKSLEEAKSVMAKDIGLAIVDVRLSEEDQNNRDGLLFLEWVTVHFPEIPVIIMSAYQEFDLAVDALNLGAAYFLRKPVNRVELRGILETYKEKNT